MSAKDAGESEISIGDRLTLEIERVAHGGHFIAHSKGMTFFVRGAITGEQVIAEVIHLKKRIALAEVVEVITPSVHRVTPPCGYFRERVCGGCDFQHIDLAFQRELKAMVVRDSFSRLAGIDIEVECQPPLQSRDRNGKSEDGFHWRSRMDFTISPGRRLALHPHRSDSLTEVTDCLIADQAMEIESINSLISNGIDKGFENGLEHVIKKDIQGDLPSPWDRIRVGVDSDGARRVSPFDKKIMMKVLEKEFLISLGSFWQPHRDAAETLVVKMRSTLQIQAGDSVLDLYGGVGLFTRFMRDDVGDAGHVTLVESDTSALRDARAIFKGDPRVTVVGGKVEEAITRITDAHRIVLDPPRVGVAKGVIEHFARLRPRQILYISCDPATLARDAKSLIGVGYRLESVEAFDLFPMTEHIESVANFILDQTPQ